MNGGINCLPFCKTSYGKIFIIDAFNESNKKGEFFNSYFVKLAGVNELKKQIINGIPENEIRKSWKKDLDKFKLMRKKYLIYHNKND